MEAFNVFATLSLVDLISKPLGAIGGQVNGLGSSLSSLGTRMGAVTAAMGPLALAAGVLLGALGLTTRQAIAFESSMADVAKVVSFDTADGLENMSNAILDMSTTIPMAAEGLAAIVAAAAQSGVAREDLTAFAEQAAKMGVAFDLTGDQAGKMMADWRAGMNLTLPRVYALADATNHLSNNMNATAPALGEVLQRVGAVAMAAGLTETQVAALGAAFLSAGASPEVASTALRKFTSTLVKGTAMSQTAQDAFAGLGFSVTQMAKDMQTDAQGTIMSVLQAIADKPKELQVSLLTEMFGEEAVSAIAPLLANMGNLHQAFDLVGDSANYAGSMQGEFEARSKTTENALMLLSNKFKALMIVVGTYFLPAINTIVGWLGTFVDMLRAAAQTTAGEFALKLIAGVSTAIVAFTAFSGIVTLLAIMGPKIAIALAPLKAILLGISWPVWVIIAAVGALYLAYQTNFGGIADIFNRWWTNISLVVRGVMELFSSLTGGVGEIRGQLATDIEAAGLTGLVASIGGIIYRIQSFFTSLWSSVSSVGDVISARFSPVIDRLSNAFSQLFSSLGTLTGGFLNFSASSDVSTWERFGSVIGNVLVTGVDLLCMGFSALLTPIEMAIAAVQFFVDLFNGVSLFDAGAKLLGTFADGIMSMINAPFEAAEKAFSFLGKLLPHSDADEGPLSTLTASGMATLTTMGEGMNAAAPALHDTLGTALDESMTPQLEAATSPQVTPEKGTKQNKGQGQGTNITIHNVNLPNVSNAQDFIAALQNMVASYDGITV